MRTTFPIRSASIVALALALACAAAPLPLRAQGPRERTMFVSAVDAKGEPVDALGPSDFIVREDGAAREVLGVSRAIAPMDIAILIDNGAASEGVIPRVREGLGAFIGVMAKGNQIALVGLADRPTIFVNYTQSTTQLRDGIGLLWPRTQSATTLLDGIFEVARGLEKRDAPRAVIIPIITDGADFANRQFNQVADEVKLAGVSIHAITVGTFAPSDDDDIRNRARVLSETTRVSGGQWVTLLTPSAVQQALERLGRELSSQYKVVYGRPDSLIPPEKIGVSARRPGVTMRGTLERGTGNTK